MAMQRPDNASLVVSVVHSERLGRLLGVGQVEVDLNCNAGHLTLDRHLGISGSTPSDCNVASRDELHEAATTVVVVFCKGLVVIVLDTAVIGIYSHF